MARPSEEFERSVVELEKKVGFVEMWGKVVCLSGGILLGVLGWNMNAMMAASAQAKADAAGALESLTQAKADATMEIQAKGVALLEGYRGQFAGWVAEHTAAVAPRGLAVAWTAGGRPPQGWRLCDGGDGTPDINGGAILVGDASESPVVGDGLLAATELKRVLGAINNQPNGGITNIYMSAMKVRFICRV